MPNAGNLRTPTHKEAKERGRVGGIKSGEAKARKRAMKDTLRMLLAMPLPQNMSDIKKKMTAMGIDEKDQTYQMALVVGAVNRGAKGDASVLSFIRDTIGENPTYLLKKAELDVQKLKAEAERMKTEESGITIIDDIQGAENG